MDKFYSHSLSVSGISLFLLFWMFSIIWTYFFIQDSKRRPHKQLQVYFFLLINSQREWLYDNDLFPHPISLFAFRTISLIYLSNFELFEMLSQCLSNVNIFNFITISMTILPVLGKRWVFFSNAHGFAFFIEE